MIVPCILATTEGSVLAELKNYVVGELLHIDDLHNVETWNELSKNVLWQNSIVFTYVGGSLLNAGSLARIIKKYLPECRIIGIFDEGDFDGEYIQNSKEVSRWIASGDISESLISEIVSSNKINKAQMQLIEYVDLLFKSTMDSALVLSKNDDFEDYSFAYKVEFANESAKNCLEVFAQNYNEARVTDNLLPLVWLNHLFDELSSVWETSETVEKEVNFGNRFPMFRWFSFKIIKYSNYLVVNFRNISSVKNDKAQHKEHNEIFRIALQSLRSHIWILDENGIVTEVNDHWKIVQGDQDSGIVYRRGIGRSFRNAFEAIIKDRNAAINMEALVLGVIESGQGNFIKEYLKPSSGSRKEIQHYLMTVTPLQGGMKGAVVSHLNITEKKRAQEQLEISRRQQNLVSTLGNLALSGYPSESLAKTMLRFGIEGLDADFAAIYLVQPDSEFINLLDYQSQKPLSTDVPESLRWKNTEQEVALSQGRFIKNSLLNSGASFEASQLYGMLDPRSIYIGAIMLRAGIWGSFIVTSKNEKLFKPEDIVFLEGLAHILSTSLEREEIDIALKNQMHQVEALRDVELVVVSEKDLSNILKTMLHHLTTNLNVKAAAIILEDINGNLNVEAVSGFHESFSEQCKQLLSESNVRTVLQTQMPIGVTNFSIPSNPDRVIKSHDNESLKNYLALPISAKGRKLGVLELYHSELFPKNKEWKNFLEALCIQVAVAVYSTTLSHELGNRNAELVQAYDQTLEGWSMALDFRDRETMGHSLRVTKATVRLARAIGIPEDEIEHIRRGALLHDIGKMGIPDSILLKPGPLDEKEWEIMKLHPIYAQQMLEPIAFLVPAMDIPFCHHERWDGKGYPQGIKGEEIPLAARVFAVIDVWDALRSDRPYRKGWPTSKIISYIKEQSGSHFDPEVVKAFMEIWDSEGVNAFV